MSLGTPEIESNRMIIPISARNHDPILINGNSELATFIENEGLSGDGTEVSPYIIEDLTIDASTANGMDIQYTDEYIIIRNCTIDGVGRGYHGIYVNNTANINISNNHLSNLWGGINIRNSIKNAISENNVNNNYVGIYINCSNYTTLSNNIANYNTFVGVELSFSNNNTLLDNTVDNNPDEGILLFYSNYNAISGSFSNNNNMGIDLFNSSNNRLFKNDVSKNNGGIYLYNSTNNEFYFNNLYENRNFEAEYDDGCTDNQWDNGTAGNYWGNYRDKYPDATNDGTVWDTPYEIGGESLGIDNFPLVRPVILKETIKIPGFPLIDILIFVSVGVFLLGRKVIHRRI